MNGLRQEHRTGIDAVHSTTRLLQRHRAAHPTHGLFEAAELEFRWGAPHTTDDLAQLVWFDEGDLPTAAAVITAFNDRTHLDPIVGADADRALIAHVIDSGLAHAAAAGFDTVHLEIDRSDHVVADLITARGFVAHEDGLVESWLTVDQRPAISPLADGYRLATRLETADRPHHMSARAGPGVEDRLHQTSLYRPDLDLIAIDAHGDIAASGLFWHDPMTEVGVIEPMFTEQGHRRRGLARHILTAGIELLADARARRVKISYELANDAARHLYLDVGFEPATYTEIFHGPTRSSG